MNKRILLSIMFACILISVHAQIAKWMVRPNYDHIEMLDCGLMKVSMNGKIGLLNDIGKEILPLKYDSITAFKEGYALPKKTAGLPYQWIREHHRNSHWHEQG